MPTLSSLHLGYLSLGSLLWVAMFAGCGERTLPGDAGPQVKFKDEVQTNSPAKEDDLKSLKFVDGKGQPVDLKAFQGQKNVVLVITRGYVSNGNADAGQGTFCTYCSTQTSRLIANYSQFQSRDTEVLVVFPVARESDSGQLAGFAAKVQGEGKKPDEVPFPLLLDVDLHAVDALGIRADLSKPATYILDKQGEVRFAYVGQSATDRPSVKALLAQLDLINKTAK